MCREARLPPSEARRSCSSQLVEEARVFGRLGAMRIFEDHVPPVDVPPPLGANRLVGHEMPPLSELERFTSPLIALESTLAEITSTQHVANVYGDAHSRRVGEACIEALRVMETLLPPLFSPCFARLAEALPPCIFSDVHVDNLDRRMSHEQVASIVAAKQVASAEDRAEQAEAAAEALRAELKQARDEAKALAIQLEEMEKLCRRLEAEAKQWRKDLKHVRREADDLAVRNAELEEDAEATIEGRVITMRNEKARLEEQVTDLREHEASLLEQLRAANSQANESKAAEEERDALREKVAELTQWIEERPDVPAEVLARQVCAH